MAKKSTATIKTGDVVSVVSPQLGSSVTGFWEVAEVEGSDLIVVAPGSTHPRIRVGSSDVVRTYREISVTNEAD